MKRPHSETRLLSGVKNFEHWKICASLVAMILISCHVRESAPADAKSELQKAVTAAPVEEQVATEIEAPEFDTEYLMGKFDPAKHPDFVLLSPKHAGRNDMLLRKETYDAFIQMYEAAKQAGVPLLIISATRNFERQKQIWEAKWTGAQLVGGEDISKTIKTPAERALKILEYSSMPGSSRHHWGTDIDLNNLSEAHFQTPEGRKVYEWLREHAAEYGFCQPYSPQGEDRPNGYHEEKWHWSYMPIAKKLTLLARKNLKDEMISGFKGAETATSIGVVKNYVLGINQECVNE